MQQEEREPRVTKRGLTILALFGTTRRQAAGTYPIFTGQPLPQVPAAHVDVQTLVATMVSAIFPAPLWLRILAAVDAQPLRIPLPKGVWVRAPTDHASRDAGVDPISWPHLILEGVHCHRLTIIVAVLGREQ